MLPTSPLRGALTLHGAGDAGEDGQRIPGDVNIHILQIVLAGATYPHELKSINQAISQLALRWRAKAETAKRLRRDWSQFGKSASRG